MQVAVDACVFVARSCKSEHIALEAWCIIVKLLKDCKTLTKDWEDLVWLQKDGIPLFIIDIS